MEKPEIIFAKKAESSHKTPNKELENESMIFRNTT